MSAQPEGYEGRYARLDQRVQDCQTRAGECRGNNEKEHLEIFTRLRAVETLLAVLGKTVAMWAALGSIVGGALVTLIMRKLFP